MVLGFRKKSNPTQATAVEPHNVDHDVPLDQAQSKFAKLLPVFACGAGLFSDGYVNNVIGSVNTILSLEYKDAYTQSTSINNVSSIAFAGTVVGEQDHPNIVLVHPWFPSIRADLLPSGQLLFGYLADHWSRVNSLLVSTVILIIFTALAAGSYWHGETAGLLSILVAW